MPIVPDLVTFQSEVNNAVAQFSHGVIKYAKEKETSKNEGGRPD
jgi:hypothetical protein